MAENSANYLGKPVHSLQAMLRQISYHYRTIPRLVPDGLYGEETREAVVIFQREFQLPVTGEVDNVTWDAIVRIYAESTQVLENPLPTNGFPDRLYTIAPGDRCVYLLMIQGMFSALSRVLEEVEPGVINGSHTGASVRNVRWIQRKGQLPETGVLGKSEWNLLARVYEVFLIRSHEPDACQLLDFPPTTARRTEDE